MALEFRSTLRGSPICVRQLSKSSVELLDTANAVALRAAASRTATVFGSRSAARYLRGFPRSQTGHSPQCMIPFNILRRKIGVVFSRRTRR